MLLLRRLQRPLALLLLAGWTCVLWPPQVAVQAAPLAEGEAPPAAFGHDLPPPAFYAPAAPKATPSPQRDLAAARLVRTLQAPASLTLVSEKLGRAAIGHPADPAFAHAPTRAP